MTKVKDKTMDDVSIPMDDFSIPIEVDDAEFILDFEEWDGNATTTTQRILPSNTKTVEIPQELLLQLRRDCCLTVE